MLNINCLAVFGFVESYSQSEEKNNYFSIVSKKCSNHNENKNNYSFLSGSNKDEEVLYDLKLKFLDFDYSKNNFVSHNQNYKYLKKSYFEENFYGSDYYYNLVGIIKSNT